MATLKCFIAGRVSSWSEELTSVTNSSCTTIYYLLTDDFSNPIDRDSYLSLQIPVESVKLTPTDESITIESTEGNPSIQFLVFEAEIPDSMEVYLIIKKTESDATVPMSFIINDLIHNSRILSDLKDDDTIIFLATPSRPPDPDCI